MFDILTIKEVQEQMGSWCKSLRTREKMSQEKLADQLALSRLTIANLENGKNFTIDTFLKVLQHFNQLNKMSEFAKNNTFSNQSLY